ncbi:tRNA (adenosine(37)-N6)-dimethylallyltransferase MiaA [Virgibacillus soli]|uniref:tRNA (adenosine(37)-N6)-dimethylallyltransferase MiaA n=1 Tax=Paracerasibacillus soli TaxID=480284 RepID=UPI0035E83691
MKKKVVAIVGPTAVGKTALSIQIAKKCKGEIISGDSMQIYKGMDIGTAKITASEREGIPHYMIDIKNPDEPFSVAEFQQLVHQKIDDIHGRGKLPIIVGGTGLYIQAVLYNYNFSQEKRDEALTTQLEERVQKEGIMPLYQELLVIDPVQAKQIHPNNERRVIRALEVYKTTGMTMSEYIHKQQQLQEKTYDAYLIGLEMERTILYERINKRVDLMIANGLIDEVYTFYKQGFEKSQAMQAIGYKEFIPYFKGEYDLAESIRLLKRNSRRYAKRQYTWFRNKMNVNWYPVIPGQINETSRIILADLAGFLEDK